MKNQKKRNLLFHALVPAVLAAFMIPTTAFAAEECRVSIPPVTVEVTGSGAPRDQAYELVLEKDPDQAAADVPMPEKTVVTVLEGEEAVFGEILYQVPGDYKYIISQTADDSVKNITYDSDGAYGFTVRITNGSNGGLVSQVWAYREKDKDLDLESKVTDIRFTNQYIGGGNSEDPGKDPDDPGNDPDNPGEDPDNPGGDPGNPGGDPGNPGGDPGNPGENPGTPGGNPGSSGGRPSGGRPGSSSGSSSGGGPGVEGDGLTQIEDETTPLGGLIPEGLGEIIPETIMDAIIPLAMLPQTGDTTSLGLWVLLLVLSGSGLAGLMAMRKRVI